MSSQEVTLIMHRNILGDLPERLAEHASKLVAQPNAQAAILACRDVILMWLKQDGVRLRCTRSEASWEWLRDVCCEMKAFATSTVIQCRLEMWRREREAAFGTLELRKEKEAFLSRGGDA